MDAIRRFLAQRFHVVVVALAAFYGCLQVAYIAHLPLVMDEFDGAYEAYRLRHSLPYRDFSPYKTVLGYYAETAGTFAATSVWPRILAVKMEVALINVAMLIALAVALARLVQRPAVIAALTLLIVCSTFLERSSELRVDMLTAWAGVWSLMLLRGRPGWSGAAAGLSFLVSQKGALYIVAGAATILAQWLIIDRNRSGGRKFARYAGAASAAIALYVVLWGAATSFRTVLDATFVGGAHAALVNVYDIRLRYWRQIFTRDPGYFLVTAAALWTTSKRATAICIYAIVLLCEAAAYSQPWPYFFVLIFPTLFALHAVFFDQVRWRTPVVVAIVLIALIYPLRRVAVVLQRHNDYQRYNVDLASGLLGPSDTYLAGSDIIHDHEQWPPDLARLGAPVIVDLKHQSPASVAAIVRALDRRPPKLVIGSYRIYSLPPLLLSYIGEHYNRVSGSVFLYAPLVGEGTVRLAFPGQYQVDAQNSGAAAIDGVAHPAGSQVSLTAGVHRVIAGGPVRLRLVPSQLGSLLDAEYLDERDLYPSVYDY